MMDIEKFRAFFQECSFWRGGADRAEIINNEIVHSVHIKVDDKYIHLDFVFDVNGKWTETRKTPSQKVKGIKNG